MSHSFPLTLKSGTSMSHSADFISSTFCVGFSIFSFDKIIAQEAVKKNSSGGTLHNISSYRYQKWENHFKSITDGAILSDTKSKCLHFWIGKNNFYKIYPTSVPLTPELTRTGYTKIIKKNNFKGCLDSCVFFPTLQSKYCNNSI